MFIQSLPVPHELLQHVDGHGEDDGGVLLSRDGAQGLQVAQLQPEIITREPNLYTIIDPLLVLIVMSKLTQVQSSGLSWWHII